MKGPQVSLDSQFGAAAVWVLQTPPPQQLASPEANDCQQGWAGLLRLRDGDYPVLTQENTTKKSPGIGQDRGAACSCCKHSTAGSNKSARVEWWWPEDKSLSHPAPERLTAQHHRKLDFIAGNRDLSLAVFGSRKVQRQTDWAHLGVCECARSC